MQDLEITPMQALVVDDDQEHAQIYANLIHGPDLEVRTFTDGRAAIEALRKTEIHLVLTDLRMPGMDGMEILSRVRTGHPEVVVIMVTGSGDLRAAVRAMQLGAFSYFEKGGEPDELRAEVRKALELIRVRRENALPPAQADQAGIAESGTFSSLREIRLAAEAAHIENVLRQVQGNRTHAARILGITYRQILNRLKDLSL